MARLQTDKTDEAIGRILSVQVGMPRRQVMPAGVRVDFRHPTWTSGIFKETIAGAVNVTFGGVEGDGQADLEFHGGPDNIVLAYNGGLYPMWREALAMPELAFGAFGENFTVEGFADDAVCIGDTWEIGPKLVMQVTQARMPCFKLARRLQQPHIVKAVREGGNGGWYLRVLAEGPAEAGMAIRRVAQPHPEWPVSKAVRVMYKKSENPELARQLLAVAELSARWKAQLAEE